MKKKKGEGTIRRENKRFAKSNNAEDLAEAHARLINNKNQLERESYVDKGYRNLVRVEVGRSTSQTERGYFPEAAREGGKEEKSTENDLEEVPSRCRITIVPRVRLLASSSVDEGDLFHAARSSAVDLSGEMIIRQKGETRDIIISLLCERRVFS